MTASASAAVASHGVAFPREPAVPSSTATSVSATARMAGRRASMTGQAASATSQPVTAATDQDSLPKTTNAALAVSTTAIAGSGNLLITAIGAVPSRPRTSARLGADRPGRPARLEHGGQPRAPRRSRSARPACGSRPRSARSPARPACQARTRGSDGRPAARRPPARPPPGAARPYSSPHQHARTMATARVHPAKEAAPYRGISRRRPAPSRSWPGGRPGASPAPDPVTRLAGSRAAGAAPASSGCPVGTTSEARPVASVTAFLILVASSQDALSAAASRGREQPGLPRGGQRGERPRGPQRGHGSGMPELEQLRDPLGVGEPARAELDVQGRVDAPGHPFCLHPGLDSLDFPNGCVGHAPGRDSGPRRRAR